MSPETNIKSSSSKSELEGLVNNSDHGSTASNAETIKNSPKSSRMAWFRLGLLLAIVLQNSSTVLISRYLRYSVPKEEFFVVNHLVCVVEIAKVREGLVCMSP